MDENQPTQTTPQQVGVQTQAPLPQTPPVIVNSQKEHYLSSLFKGRLNRRNYWIGGLFVLAIPFICFLILVLMNLFHPTNLALPDINNTNSTLTQNAAKPTDIISQILTPIIIIANMVAIALSFPYLLSLQIRRLHDLNKSGWFILINFVPFIGFLFALYVDFWAGTTGENKYGAQPLARVNIKQDIFKLK